MLLTGSQETVFTVALSSLLSYLIGIPFSILPVATDKDGIQPNGTINIVLGITTNLMRSVPFIIMLLVALLPTRFIVRATPDLKAVVVLLVLTAVPYTTRMVGGFLREVGAGVVETARPMGASNFRIIWKTMLPEAKPPLLMGAATFITTILSYSTMAGFVGGGGLDTLAINYGYYRYQTDAMFVIVVVLVIVAQLIQESFLWMTRHAGERAR